MREHVPDRRAPAAFRGRALDLIGGRAGAPEEVFRKRAAPAIVLRAQGPACRQRRHEERRRRETMKTSPRNVGQGRFPLFLPPLIAEKNGLSAGHATAAGFLAAGAVLAK